MALSFITRVVMHELTHVGAMQNNEADPMFIEVLQGDKVMCIERGDNFESNAFGKPIQYTDCEAGILVYKRFNFHSYKCADAQRQLRGCFFDNNPGNGDGPTKSGSDVNNFIKTWFPDYYREPGK